MTTIDELVSILKKNVEEKTFVDVSPGVEKLFDVSERKFRTALERLKTQNEGDYQFFKRIKTQVGTDKKVTLNLLAKKGVTYREVYDADIRPIEKEDNDN